MLVCSSITVPTGHWQPLATQTCGQITVVFTLAHVVLHAEAHSTRVWPTTGQSVVNDNTSKTLK